MQYFSIGGPSASESPGGSVKNTDLGVPLQTSLVRITGWEDGWAWWILYLVKF